jgi:SAM-dependent methyltransferase
MGADVGCGNGKYIKVNENVFVIGSDRSEKLIEIVNKKGYEGVIADGLGLGFRDECFDFCISIAVIHHFSNQERRIEAIKEILRILKKGGTALIYVWAMEQEKNSKRRFESQDEMVSWKMQKPESTEHTTYQR